ncbi:hypothetical protein [Fastidiosibacter lacustris]|uniref:hypothetical protein n=1 Tax=Fastidiosibacter lacustris TaxID=2056695 RepID=UPI0013005794|nr:hypothetical protein [Fastidiosibacter lacustris]
MLETEKELLIKAVSNPVYANIDTWEIINNPWLRPLRPSSFKYLNSISTLGEKIYAEKL